VVLYDLQEACLWDLRTFLAYSPDGKTLVWASNGGNVRLYDDDVQSWQNRARGIANRDLLRRNGSNTWASSLSEAACLEPPFREKLLQPGDYRTGF
jgi:WD40 repeat protein